MLSFEIYGFEYENALKFAVLYDTWSKVFVYWIIMFANILVQFLVKLSL